MKLNLSIGHVCPPLHSSAWLRFDSTTNSVSLQLSSNVVSGRRTFLWFWLKWFPLYMENFLNGKLFELTQRCGDPIFLRTNSFKSLLFAKTSKISQFELLVCSLVFNERCSRSIKECHSNVGDHRPLPVLHSTGATVSSSPQHHGSTSSPTNDVSSMSTDPTVTDTDSSLEAAASTASLGYCRWLSFPCHSGPVLPPPTGSSSMCVVCSLAIS